MKDVAVTVDPMLLVVVDEAVLVMKNFLRETGLVGYLSAVVVLAAGRHTFLVCVTITFCCCICKAFLLFLRYTSRGEIKREGAGRGNWGTQADEVTQ